MSVYRKAFVLTVLPVCAFLSVARAGDDTKKSPPTTQVSIDNFSFAPEKLTITVGTQVTWVNHDDVPHTATSSTKPREFDSHALDTDQQYAHVFTKPGVYTYFCAVHPHMTGEITVKEVQP